MKQTLDLAAFTQALRKAPRVPKTHAQKMGGTEYLAQHAFLPMCFEQTVRIRDIDFDRFDETDVDELFENQRYSYPTISLLQAADEGKPAMLQHATFC